MLTNHATIRPTGDGRKRKAKIRTKDLLRSVMQAKATIGWTCKKRVKKRCCFFPKYFSGGTFSLGGKIPQLGKASKKI